MNTIAMYILCRNIFEILVNAYNNLNFNQYKI